MADFVDFSGPPSACGHLMQTSPRCRGLRLREKYYTQPWFLMNGVTTGIWNI